MMENKAIGVDLGGTNIRIAEINSYGEIVYFYSEKVPAGRQAQLDTIKKCIEQLLSSEIKAVGLGFPGRVRRADGTAVTAGYLDLKDIPLVSFIMEITQLPTYIDTDANMALYAEMQLGSAVGAREVALLTIGTGIGGAIASGGKLFYGSNYAGQLGHINVDKDGETCNCGRKGCVETKSSGTALNRLLASSSLSPDMRVEELLVLDSQGDKTAHSVLSEWITPLRSAMDTIAAVLNPELILLGGGLGGVAFQVLQKLSVRGSAWFEYEVRACSLGDSAGVIGSGLMALSMIGENA
ncbi:MAG TPA: hypothetical protein DCK95_04105 [Anaerolineaceae bacterium]|nr:hypothetical protein [Anaerolineaceae bacterium]